MSQELYDGIDMIVLFLKAFRVYGISLYEVNLWISWLAVAIILVFHFLSNWQGGGHD